jgi:hypothetical protein
MGREEKTGREGNGEEEAHGLHDGRFQERVGGKHRHGGLRGSGKALAAQRHVAHNLHRDT